MNVAHALDRFAAGFPPAPALPCRVAIVGFGTVGQSLARLIARPDGAAVAVTHICNRRVDRKRVAWMPPSVQWTESIAEAVHAPDVDVVVELMGGVEPAFSCMRDALAAGKAVVTANKQVIASHGAELFDLATRHGVALRCEAAAGGAVPIVRALAESLSADRITGITGVLNGTSNFVLECVESGARTLSDAIAEAQALGIAEADPSADLDGADAAAKLALLSLFAFGAAVDPASIPRATIRTVGRDDFMLARRLGLVLKPVTYARRAAPGSAIAAWVGPALVAAASPLAHVSRARNVVLVSGEHSGETVLAGEGAGGDPTAVAVLSDVLSIAHHGHWNAPPVAAGSTACEEPTVPHFVRLALFNRAAALPAAIAAVHAAGLAVSDVVTLAADARHTQIALGVGPCRTSDLRAAVDEIERTGSCDGRATVLPVLTAERG